MSALDGWTALARSAREQLWQDELAHRMWVAGEHVIFELMSEIARLRAELDEAGSSPVLLCMDRDMDTAAVASMDAEPGTVLRATDTGRELVLRGGSWHSRQ